MKNFFLMLTTLLFLSCQNDYKEGNKSYSFPRFTSDLNEINIDGCQYLYGDWGNATVLTHKGNCNNIYHYK